MMKRVLIVSGLFPPAGGPGAKRILQFVRNLLPLGWDPVVLTHRENFMGYDEESLKQIPHGIMVCRTRSFEQYFRTKPRYADEGHGDIKNHAFWNLRESLFVRFIKNTVGAPDTGLLWGPFALFSAVKIFIKAPFDVVFVTGPPFSSFLIGLGIKFITRQPLVLDFRDAWSANPTLIDGDKIKVRLHKFYEKISVRFADFVLANTEGVYEDFLKRYPFQDKSKFVVISNGFDEEDIVALKNLELGLNPSKFKIVHTGSLGGIRNPKLFLKAISELIDEKKISPELIEIHLVGLMSDFEDGHSIVTYVDEFRLTDQIFLKGFVPREDAFRYDFEADVLLLVIGVTNKQGLSTYGLSGKVFDYVITGKPILALAQEDGMTYRLLRKNNIGVIANPCDLKDIKGKVLELYNAWLRGELQSNYHPSVLESHNMKTLTVKLGSVFDSAIEGMSNSMQK